MRPTSTNHRIWVLPIIALVACEDVTTDPDGGVPDGGTCATAPAENATNQAKAEATLPTDQGEKFMVVAYATSELRTNETTDLTYAKAQPGGLLGGRAGGRVAGQVEPELAGWLSRLERRVSSEAGLRARSIQGPLTSAVRGGTAIRSYTDPKLGVQAGSQACTADAPGACKAQKAVCVIPEGTTNGVCASSLSLKFALTDQANPTAVTAAVRVVTDNVAIVVDEADAAAVSDADLEKLAKRFDERIAPVSRALFGEAVAAGKDFDGNGVTTIFVTSKLSGLGSDIVGIFFSDDLRPSAEAAHSNVSDLLYVSPLGATVTLDQLSGTIAHEYEHLINFYAKVVKGHSDREAAWLDEGLGVFAEDATGYGADAFATHYAYLQDPGNYSLTGNGVLGDGDTVQRRGMASLFVRYLFEQSGGGDLDAASPSGAGVSAIRALVQGTDIELEAVGKVPGRTVHQWIGNFLAAVALDGTSYDCLSKYSFAPVAVVQYTGIQRGVNLRGTFNAGSTTITFKGPVTNTLEAESVPFAWNAGEFRTVDGKGLTVSAAVPADNFDGDLERVGLWVVPLAN
ncbi:MAG: hypothetical protein HYV07_06695 [Deltaproteobacteria bacterium]|nr:hypothetical protein [Deltaproteobacteria bacterium]